MSTEPQAPWNLRTYHVNPPDTTHYLTISQSENCAQADHIPCDRPPPLTLAFKSALPKPFCEPVTKAKDQECAITAE